jgi:hypothetical protein
MMSHTAGPTLGRLNATLSDEHAAALHTPINRGDDNASASVVSSDSMTEVKEYVKKGMWSMEEDETLSKYAKLYLFSGPKQRGRLDWRPVAAHIPGRNSKVCM